MTEGEKELIVKYVPSDGIEESDSVCFTDDMIIDFAKQYHKSQFKKVEQEKEEIKEDK